MNDTCQIILALSLCFVIVCLGLLMLAGAYNLYTDAKYNYISDADYAELRRLKDLENNMYRES